MFAPWILSASTSTGIPKPLQNPITSAMGLRRLDGSWKPAASVVRAMFGGARNLSFTANELAASKIDDDGGFDREDARASTTGRLGSWRPFDSGAGTLGVGRDVGVDGSAGAILRRTGGDHSTIPALTQTFLLLSGKRTVSVRAQLRLADATGFSGVGIAWFGGGRYLGGTESRSAEPAPGAWVAVSATATAPRPPRRSRSTCNPGATPAARISTALCCPDPGRLPGVDREVDLGRTHNANTGLRWGQRRPRGARVCRCPSRFNS